MWSGHETHRFGLNLKLCQDHPPPTRYSYISSHLISSSSSRNWPSIEYELILKDALFLYIYRVRRNITAMKASVYLVAIIPALVAQAARIVQSNDDGWAELYLRSFNDALNEAGHDVVLSAPADNQSGTGTCSSSCYAQSSQHL